LAATFDQPHASSDAGAILLKAARHQPGLLAALTAATSCSPRRRSRIAVGGRMVDGRRFARICKITQVHKFRRNAYA